MANLNSISTLIFLVIFKLCSSKTPIVPLTQDKLTPDIEFYSKEIKNVVENEEREIYFGMAWKNNSDLENILQDVNFEYAIFIHSENPSILRVVNSSRPLCVIPIYSPKNFSFTVKGIFLGYTKLQIEVVPATNNCQNQNKNDSMVSEISVSVIRKPSILVDIVTGIMAALVAFNYVNMGVQLDLYAIGKVLKKPIGPTIGFICQFFFMPLAAYGISWLLLDDISLRLGLFTLGCSPGGSMSNFWTLLFYGDVNLSITMTFISTVAALAMMPLWIFTLGRGLFRDREATIPYVNLAGSLIILTIPIGFGLLIKQYSPRLTKFSEKIIKPVTLICVVFGVFVGLYANSFVFKLFTWRVLLSGIGIAWGGYSFGALTAWLFRLNKSQIIAVSIETAFQNPAVAFVMLLMSLPQPEADLTSVPVICQLILTGMPMWVLLIITRIYKKLRGKNSVEEKESNPPKLEIDKEYIPVNTEVIDSLGNNVPLVPENNNYVKPQIVPKK